MKQPNDPDSHPGPPQWPLKLLRFFVKKEYVEEIEGDICLRYYHPDGYALS